MNLFQTANRYFGKGSKLEPTTQMRSISNRIRQLWINQPKCLLIFVLLYFLSVQGVLSHIYQPTCGVSLWWSYGYLPAAHIFPSFGMESEKD